MVQDTILSDLNNFHNDNEILYELYSSSRQRISFEVFRCSRSMLQLKASVALLENQALYLLVFCMHPLAFLE